MQQYISWCPCSGMTLWKAVAGPHCMWSAGGHEIYFSYSIIKLPQKLILSYCPHLFYFIAQLFCFFAQIWKLLPLPFWYYQRCTFLFLFFLRCSPFLFRFGRILPPLHGITVYFCQLPVNLPPFFNLVPSHDAPLYRFLMVIVEYRFLITRMSTDGVVARILHCIGCSLNDLVEALRFIFLFEHKLGGCWS